MMGTSHHEVGIEGIAIATREILPRSDGDKMHPTVRDRREVRISASVARKRSYLRVANPILPGFSYGRAENSKCQAPGGSIHSNSTAG